MSDPDESEYSSESECSDDSENEAEVDLCAPKPIKLKNPAWDAKFHPIEPIIVSGDLDGVIRAWRFNDESKDTPSLELEKLVHGGHFGDGSVRGLTFSPSGARLFSIGTDKQLLVSDVETGQGYMSLQDAFEDAPYCISSTNENIIATGDEGGVVRLFDIRKKNPIDELLIDDGRCEDGINDIYQSSDGKYLLAASGDGTLCAYNSKRKMFLMESESMGSDLCSVIGIKNEQKALVTASDGMIHLYNWKEFGHPSDMFPGHVKGDLVCCKMTEQIILTGDVKGTIRAVNIMPNRILDTIGTHQKGIPIERLDVYQNRLALSIGVGSHEIRFWNLDNVKPIMEGSKEARKKSKVTQRATSLKKKAGFWAGFDKDLDVKLEENLHSSDDEDSADESNVSDDKRNETNEDNQPIDKMCIEPSTDVTNTPTLEERILSFPADEILEKIGKPSTGVISEQADYEDTPGCSTQLKEELTLESSNAQKRTEKVNSHYKNKRRKKNAKSVTQ